MQLNAVLLAITTLASIAIASPVAPLPSIEQLEQLLPGAQESYDELATGHLEKRGLEKRCLYDGANKCHKCTGACSLNRTPGGFAGCMLYCYTVGNCC